MIWDPEFRIRDRDYGRVAMIGRRVCEGAMKSPVAVINVNADIAIGMLNKVKDQKVLIAELRVELFERAEAHEQAVAGEARALHEGSIAGLAERLAEQDER